MPLPKSSVPMMCWGFSAKYWFTRTFLPDGVADGVLAVLCEDHGVVDRHLLVADQFVSGACRNVWFLNVIKGDAGRATVFRNCGIALSTKLQKLGGLLRGQIAVWCVLLDKLFGVHVPFVPPHIAVAAWESVLNSGANVGCLRPGKSLRAWRKA